MLADYVRTLPIEYLGPAVTWFTGLPFPSSENKVLQTGWALLRDALCAVSGLTETEFHHVYLKHSDLGESACEILQQRRGNQLPGLCLAEVQALFAKVHGARGPSVKRPLLVRALESATPLEAKFLLKIVTSDLRIGLKEGLVEEAVAQAFHIEPEALRQANLLLGNIGQAAELAAQGELNRASLTPFRPVKFMLASPEETSAAIWKRMQSATNTAPVSGDKQPGQVIADGKEKRREESLSSIPRRLPNRDLILWLEDKYDGIRCQLHKVGSRVGLFSRDLKDITATFPELASGARELSSDVVLDGEILAIRGEEVLPFSALQRRLGRRDADLFMGEEIPIKFVAFDLLWRDGEMFLNQPLHARRAALESIARLPDAIRLARITRAGSIEEIEAAFVAARSRNNEGLLIKDPESVYSPGRRGLAWLKLKKAYATLDCVVVGAEYGHGKRKDVLSDYTFALRDEKTGELKTIGKAYSGLTDEEITHLTKHFLSRTVRRYGRYHEVEPEVVLEIAFDRIQPSARHASGLAMRFPRIVRIRTDKTVAEIDTVAAARRLV
jgi:DNA ligase-1